MELRPVAPASEPLKGLGPLVTIAGTSGSGQDGRKIYLKNPDQYNIDGNPLSEFVFYGKKTDGQWAGKDTGAESARFSSVVWKQDKAYYKDELTQIPVAGDEVPWKSIGAVTFINKKGEKIIIPRSELRLTKPGTSQTQTPEEETVEEVQPLSAATKKTKKETAKPSTQPQSEHKASGARYVDTTKVSRETLEKDAHFQDVLTKMRDVLQEAKKLRKDLSDLNVLPGIAQQIREVGAWSDPAKARDPQYQAFMNSLNAKGLHSDDALLASEYLLDQARRQSNEHAISEWAKKIHADGNDPEIRRSILDMVEHNTEGSVRFNKNAIEMSMTGPERNTGYQDLRAAQVASDYLLDTYDATARQRWIKDGKLTPEGLRERQDYHSFLSQVLQGDVPGDKKELAGKLWKKLDELHRLSPDEAIARYKGLLPEDKKNITSSVKRWREKFGVEPYRSGDMDLMATKGLLLIERRGNYPELLPTTDEFTRKALKESGTRKPTTPSSTEKPAAAIPSPSEPLASTVTTKTDTSDQTAIPSTSKAPSIDIKKDGAPLVPEVKETKATSTEPNATKEPQPVVPKKTGEVPKIDKVSASYVAVKGDIKHDQDVAALEARLIAKQAMEEHEKQYNPKGIKQWLATTVSRIWKHNWGEAVYTSRERIHALLSQEKAGMEGIPLPLKYELRKKALEEAGRRVQARQSASTHKNWERMKNWFKDAEGFFTDEHKESLTVLGEWKAELGKLNDSTVPQAEKDRIMADNPLYEARLASWEQSYKIADNIGQNILHGERGEQKFAEALLLKKDSPLGKRLLDEVAKPYWVGLDSHGSVGMTEALAREKLDEILGSKEFTALLATLPADKQALISSRSYANTLLETFRGVHEQVRAATDHQDALKRLDFDIELTLGVAEYGARNKVEATFGEKRSKKNAELLKKLRNRDPLFSAAILEPAGHRAELLAEVADDALKNEMFWSVFVSGGAMAATRSAASGVGKVLTPLGLGGLVSGTFGGYKEWVRLGKEFKLHNLETALGYAFPQTYEQRRFLFAGNVVNKNTRRGEMEQRSYHQRSMSEIMSRMEAIGMENGKPKAAITDAEEAKELLGLLIDTEARNRLSDRRDINLLKVKDEDPTAPHVPFESQKRDLDRVSAQTKALLAKSIASNQTLRDALITPLQAAGQTQDFAKVFDELTELHYNALEKEAGILDTRYQTALGTLSVQKGQSIDQRDKDFKKFRIWRTAAVGAKTAAFGAATGAVLREAYDLTGSIIQYGQTGQWQWHGPISSGIGNLIDRFGPHGPSTPLPLAPSGEVIQGVSDAGNNTWGVMHFSQGVHMDHGNLVFDDGKGHIDTLFKNFHPHFADNGQLSQDTLDQLKGAGIIFDKTQAWSEAVSSGTHTLIIDGHAQVVPKELILVNDSVAGHQLVMEGLHDKAGNLLPKVVVMDHVDVVNGNIQHSDKVIEALNHSRFMDITPGGHAGTAVADTLPHGVAQVTDAAGKMQEIHAMIPQGTHLVSAGGNTYNLVSDSNPNDILLHTLKFDPGTGKFINLADDAIQKESAFNNIHITSVESHTPGSSGSFDLRAGYLDDKTKYMGPNGAWGWGERVLGKGGPQDNLFKNAFRAWHNWDGNNNADIAQAEVPGVSRFVPRVPGGLVMSDGTVGYQNSFNFNMGSDNLYIRDIPQSLFSDANITRIGQVMDHAIKEADAWKAAELAVGHAVNTNDVLDHLKATDELSYLAYKHGYIGQYFTEGDWDHFRNLFEGPSSSWQTTITQDGQAWGLKTDMVENILTYARPGSGPSGPIPPFPVVPIIGRRPLEAPVRKAGGVQEIPPYPEYPEYPQYPEYPEYPEYPSYPEYPQYPEYNALYPEYPEYGLYPYGEYPQYPEYPEYAATLPSVQNYHPYIPVFEQVYEKMNIATAEREKMRKMPPEIRAKHLLEQAGLPVDENAPFHDRMNALASQFHLPSIVESPTPTPAKKESKKAGTHYPEYPENPEYNALYPSYPEYQAASADQLKSPNHPDYAPTLSNIKEYHPYLPFYERVYEHLGLAPEKRTELRALPPELRVKALTEGLSMTYDESLAYEAQLEQLAATVFAGTKESTTSPSTESAKNILEASLSIANPEHPATCEDALSQTIFQKNNQNIHRWLLVDGSGGSIDRDDPRRSNKVQEVAMEMAQSGNLQDGLSPKDVLIKADARGRLLPGYGTAIAADINEATGEVKIAHAGDAAALRWKPTPFASKRFYDASSAKGNLQLITEQHNQAELQRKAGVLKTQHLEGPESSVIYKAIGDETKPVTLVANSIVETNLTLDPDEYLILASDGARIGDMLTDGSPYQGEINYQMNRLHSGAIKIEEATKNIAEAAKRQAEREGNDYDDISVIIVKRK